MQPVSVLELGLVPYEKAVEEMKSLQAKRIEGTIRDTLLLLEHDEVVTIGPRARNDGISPPKGYRTVNVDRGGGLTWHGPGQLVAYPIFLWNRDNEKNVSEIIYKIEEWVIQSLNLLDVEAHRDERMQGVWVKGQKICSIGLSFLRWVSRHGFTINYDTPVGRVEGFAGCGLDAQTTTSLSQLGYFVSKEKLVSSLLEAMPKTIQRMNEEIEE
ncbi:MAG TPA: lipoyl(octanoyl) transferase LipB [Candidatus Poseidoniaceae archaeon]|nr:lipoyl(octanoyl) transferase LipB [Candidatus Poseidoniaceae archaeon]